LTLFFLWPQPLELRQPTGASAAERWHACRGGLSRAHRRRRRRRRRLLLLLLLL